MCKATDDNKLYRRAYYFTGKLAKSMNKYLFQCKYNNTKSNPYSLTLLTVTEETP